MSVSETVATNSAQEMCFPTCSGTLTCEHMVLHLIPLLLQLMRFQGTWYFTSSNLEGQYFKLWFRSRFNISGWSFWGLNFVSKIFFITHQGIHSWFLLSPYRASISIWIVEEIIDIVSERFLDKVVLLLKKEKKKMNLLFSTWFPQFFIYFLSLTRIKQVCLSSIVPKSFFDTQLQLNWWFLVPLVTSLD